jgi:hypothetical protein
MCKLISKLTIERQFKLDLLVIITLKQPSASQKPVIQFGYILLNILVLLLKNRVRFSEKAILSLYFTIIDLRYDIIKQNSILHLI